MHLSQSSIEQLPKVKRLNIINSISGIKPGNLVGTVSRAGIPNLAIVSSVVHLGSHPPLLGYLLRPRDEVRRDSYENILENGYFTINHISTEFIEKAHYTSAKFDQHTSEFDACGLTPSYDFGFSAPFVKESKLKVGLRHVESISIPSSNTTLIVGEIQHLDIPDDALNEHGYINLESINSAGISGLNSYYSLNKLADFPYARVHEVPKFAV
ncbi:MAG TPA: flavin oxidoreductase [Cytophagales bacterium]|nr:flavin oxidoreductase [Cytophagales bacterium]